MIKSMFYSGAALTFVSVISIVMLAVFCREFIKWYGDKKFEVLTNPTPEAAKKLLYKSVSIVIFAAICLLAILIVGCVFMILSL